MGACATKPKVLKEGANAPETREMVKADEERESKSRQSLEILLKEVGNGSETKETAIVNVKQSVQVVEQAKDEANNADVATLEKTMESPVGRVVDVRQDC